MSLSSLIGLHACGRLEMRIHGCCPCHRKVTPNLHRNAADRKMDSCPFRSQHWASSLGWADININTWNVRMRSNDGDGLTSQNKYRNSFLHQSYLIFDWTACAGPFRIVNVQYVRKVVSWKTDIFLCRVLVLKTDSPQDIFLSFLHRTQVFFFCSTWHAHRMLTYTP
jgi:hypothetical protein